MFERYRQPLLALPLFIRRVIRCVLLSLFLMGITVFVGSVGFHYLERWLWLDAILNSVLVMAGCGLIRGITNPVAKIFASFYTVFSTTVYFSLLIILISPLLHRFVHVFRLEIARNRKRQDY